MGKRSANSQTIKRESLTEMDFRVYLQVFGSLQNTTAFTSLHRKEILGHVASHWKKWLTADGHVTGGPDMTLETTWPLVLSVGRAHLSFAHFDGKALQEE